jgi:hypothetical protein
MAAGHWKPVRCVFWVVPMWNTLGVGLNGSLHASQFCILAGLGSHFPRLGAQCFG